MTDSKNLTEEHRRLIFAMVSKLMGEGFKVSANHIGYPNGLPPEFNGIMPDIHAKKGKKEIIIEADTNESLDDGQTRPRWTAFSDIEGIDFFVIVPKKAISKAKKKNKEWRLNVTQFWELDI